MDQQYPESYQDLWQERNALREQNQLLWRLVEKLRTSNNSTDRLGSLSTQSNDKKKSVFAFSSIASSFETIYEIEKDYQEAKIGQSKIDELVFKKSIERYSQEDDDANIISLISHSSDKFFDKKLSSSVEKERSNAFIEPKSIPRKGSSTSESEGNKDKLPLGSSHMIPIPQRSALRSKTEDHVSKSPKETKLIKASQDDLKNQAKKNLESYSVDKIPQSASINFHAREKYIQATSTLNPLKSDSKSDSLKPKNGGLSPSIIPRVSTFEAIARPNPKETRDSQEEDSLSDAESSTPPIYKTTVCDIEPLVIESFQKPSLVQEPQEYASIVDQYHSLPSVPEDESLTINQDLTNEQIEKAIEKTDHFSDDSSNYTSLSRNSSFRRKAKIIQSSDPNKYLTFELNERLEVLRKKNDRILVDLIQPTGTQPCTDEFQISVSGQPSHNSNEDSRLADGSIVYQKLWLIEKTWDQILAFEAQIQRMFPDHIHNSPLPSWNPSSSSPPPYGDVKEFINFSLKLPIDPSSDPVAKFLASNLISSLPSALPPKPEKKNFFKSGNLLKRGKKLGKLKLRYFVVSGPVLEYFESNDGYYLGAIKLTGAQIIRSLVASLHSEVYERYIYAITIMEPKKGTMTKHVFFVDNPADWDSWIQSLEYFSHQPAAASLPTNTTLPKEPKKAKSNESLESSNEPALPPPPVFQTKQYPDNDHIGFSPYPATATALAPQTAESSQALLNHKASDTHLNKANLAHNNHTEPTNNDKPSGKEPVKANGTTWKGFQWNAKIFGGLETFIKKPNGTNTIFGVPLDQAIAHSPVNNNYQMPSVMHRCIEYLEQKKAYLEEGIYRLSGSSADIQFLKEKFNHDGDFNLLKSGHRYDVHTAAGLLKLFLREMPTYILTQELQPEFLKAADIQDRSKRIKELGRLVCALPIAHYTLLRTLVAHLIRIVERSEINKMTLKNIAIVFVPTLAIPAGVFNLMFIEFKFIFYVNEKGDAEPKQLNGEDYKSTIEPKSDERDRRNSTLYYQAIPETLVAEERNLVIPEEELPDDEFLNQQELIHSPDLLDNLPLHTPRDLQFLS